MIVVIIAGGSGSRLWPLSTPEYPKHLLNISGEQSLVQAAYERAKHLSDTIYVITEISHAHHVKAQLPDVPDENYVIEPGRRSTSGCMLAAMHLVQSRHDHDEPVAVLWADHCIRDVRGFAQSFKLAGEMSRKYSRAVLVGIEPTYPSSGLGYIHKGAPVDGHYTVYDVAEFKEKPDTATARQLFQSGEYLWNGGYVVSTVNAFEQAITTYCPELRTNYDALLATKTPEEYNEVYLGFRSVALDYTFNELVKNLLVVPATFDWVDLGSFKDMHDFLDQDEAGNVLTGNTIVDEVENALIRNDEEKPVVVIGLDNVVVINTPQGILVTRKDLSQRVGEISKHFQDQPAAAKE
jgi:mannose-1-phosphate guanylyltransferase